MSGAGELGGLSLALTVLPAQVTKALVLRYHPLSSCLTDKVGAWGWVMSKKPALLPHGWLGAPSSRALCLRAVSFTAAGPAG